MLTTSTDARRTSPSALRIWRTVLGLDGAFLTLIGGLTFCFDLLSYYWGVGPLGATFHHLLYTIGFAEAHGLAFIFGLLLWRAARWEPSAYWHLVGAGIHLLLGTCNLLFWALVVAMDMVTLEIVITALHGLFFVVQFVCFASVWQTAKRNNQPLSLG